MGWLIRFKGERAGGNGRLKSVGFIETPEVKFRPRSTKVVPQDSSQGAPTSKRTTSAAGFEK